MKRNIYMQDVDFGKGTIFFKVWKKLESSWSLKVMYDVADQAHDLSFEQKQTINLGFKLKGHLDFHEIFAAQNLVGIPNIIIVYL